MANYTSVNRTPTVRTLWLARSFAAGAAALGVAAFALSAAPARADTPSAPAWTISSISTPTNLAPGSSGNVLQLIATNVGAAPTSGVTTVVDTLPAGLTPTAMFGNTTAGDPLSCTLATVTCTLEAPLLAGDQITVGIQVSASSLAPSTVTNAAIVSGGGALSASASQPTTISASPAAFGIQSFTAAANEADGSLSTQAGAVPYAATASFALNTVVASDGRFEPTENLKDAVVDLPAGFVGNPLATPRCAASDFPKCATDTQVGIASIKFANLSEFHVNGAMVPVYNMIPPTGTPAEFKFLVAFGQATLIPRLRTGGDYGISIESKDNTEGTTSGGLDYVSVTLWGVPGDHSHDAVRGRECLSVPGSCAPDPKAPFNAPVKPFLTNPTFCGPPLTTIFSADPWQNPGNFVSAASTTPTGTTGCGKLSFTPSISIQPDTSVADSPTGLQVDLHIPQNDETVGLAEPDLKKAVVTLPQGVTVNPAAADGLAACSPAQIDISGPGGATCPEASKIGSVEVDTPLLDHPLPGAVYLAQQKQNPFNSLLAIYIAVDDPASGVVVKLAGHVVPDPQTGQLTTTFDNNPQLPFEDLKLHFFGGSRGALATPEGCGTYTTTSDFSPWSAPASGPDATPSDSFQINSGCVSGFAPAFSGGTLSNQAGAFSPFTLSLSRNDNEEGPAGLTVALPTGLLGKIAGVAECSGAQVAAAAAHSGASEQSSPGCPSSSQLGTVTAASGPGPNPFVVGGKAYLTGPYKGAPFGIAVVVPALAGPFDLGTVVIRQALFVDPNDAHATDVSDPFPTILQGIPLRIKSVHVTLDRPGFMFNPTSCEPKAVNATVMSIGGAQAPVSSRYQAAGCAGLPFKPQSTASTQGKTSKANGASLKVKIASAGIGQAGIAKVDLTIPAILPSRLTTLQKACTEAQFNANPAGCPAASNIATATVHTPLLNSPLSGPVYFVSHGGAAFPDTEIVLQGEGVTLILEGHTQIKKGVTYSLFESVPDAPFTSFEFNAPEGPHSIFGANGNLCQTEVRMPTTLVAQNGAVINQQTLVEPEGCPNKLTILSRTVKKRTLTLKVAVPGAGKLTASGKGLSKASKSAKGRSIVTLRLRAKGHAKHKSKVKLTFAPSKGRRLTAAVVARFRT
jgi:hypothetical protein